MPSSTSDEARDHVEQRGLARAVRADEADDLAAARRERHVGQRGEPTESLRHAVEPEADRGSARASCRARAPCRPFAPFVAGTVESTAVAGTRARSAGTGAGSPSCIARRRAFEEHRAQHVGPFEQLGGRAVEADLALLHEVRGLARS